MIGISQVWLFLLLSKSSVLAQYYYKPDADGCYPTLFYPHPWQISCSQTWYPLVTLDGDKFLELDKAYATDTMSKRRHRLKGKEVDVELAGIPFELRHNDVSEYGDVIFSEQYIEIYLGVNHDIYGIVLQGGFVNETTRVNNTVVESESFSSWVETFMVSYSHDGGRNYHYLTYEEFDEIAIFHANHDGYAKSVKLLPVTIRTGNLRIHPTHVSIDGYWSSQVLARIALLVCRPRLQERIINSSGNDQNVFVPMKNPGGAYVSGYRIRWRIQAQHGGVIHLRFVSQYMLSSSSCYTSYVAVYDGFNTEGLVPEPLLYKSCGVLRRHKIVKSSGNTLEVVFETHDRHDQVSAMYSVVGAPSNGCGVKGNHIPGFRVYGSPYTQFEAAGGGVNSYNYRPSDRQYTKGQPYQNHNYYQHYHTYRDERASEAVVQRHLASSRRSRRNRRSARTKRLAMSSTAELGEWPWNVRVLKMDDDQLGHLCGGVLIHPLWVMTAGHCLFRITPPMLRLRTMDGNTYNAERLFVYHRIGVGPPNNPIANDVGLIRLAKPATINQVVNVICLPDEVEGKGDHDQTACSFTGWGTIGPDGHTPLMLQELPRPTVLPTHVCQGFWVTAAWLDEHEEICLGGQWDGRGYLCPGDSGSPYACRNKRDDKWYLEGTGGWVNTNCNKPGYPSIILRTHKYVEWMRTVMASYYDAIPENSGQYR